MSIFIGQRKMGQLTFSRYSTARSGLLKAALIARSMSARAKPMLSRFAMASARSVPTYNAFGSLSELEVAAFPEAGVGVAVTSADGAVVTAGAGAGGCAGVWLVV